MKYTLILWSVLTTTVKIRHWEKGLDRTKVGITLQIPFGSVKQTKTKVKSKATLSVVPKLFSRCFLFKNENLWDTNVDWCERQIIKRLRSRSER